MKYSLNYTQSHEYLSQCDEIRVPESKIFTVETLATKYPKVRFAVILSDNPNWDNIAGAATKAPIVCGLKNLAYAQQCKEHNLPFYYVYPVNSFFELRGLKDLGAEYAYTGMPIFFQMPIVKEVGIKIRCIPNVAYEAFIPQATGVCGQWIRPEDMEAYEPYIDICEFAADSPEQEKALFRIYAQDKHWSGDLNDLIKNLNYPCKNLAVYKGLADIRISCGQVCQQRGGCKYCYRALGFGTTVAKYGEMKQKILL